MDEQVGRVLAEVWRGTGGYVFFSSRKGRTGWVDQAYEWPHAMVRSLIDAYKPEVDLYWCPLVFSQPRRKAEYALPTHVLWADLDEADPRKCALRPSVAWQTTQGGITTQRVSEYNVVEASEGRPAWKQRESVEVKPHWQALWLLGQTYSQHVAEVMHPDPDLDVREYQQKAAVMSAWLGRTPTHDYHVMQRQIISAQAAASLSKRIAYAEPGADRSGWDVTQVLRLPGTYNHKHTPPQPVKLLWAKRLYYTVEQVRSAYPPVPEARASSSNGAAGWHEFTPAEIAAALRALPMGLQMALERDDGGADRSLELFRLARELLSWKVAPVMAAALLEMSALGRSKYGSRKDGRQRLLTTVADAMADE